jgi:hypothetical protein
MLSALMRSAAVIWQLLTGASDGVISELEPGDGPEWGTLSGLTAHPSDPSLLYAVTDADSRPLRILEIKVTQTAARVVRQIPIASPDVDSFDPEAIVAKPDGGFWLASEGGKRDTPPNLLLEVDASGEVLRRVALPPSVSARMPKKGFEGVALDASASGTRLYVAFQAPLVDEPVQFTRIGCVDVDTGSWRFYSYPLEELGSGEHTGLSELVHLGQEKFAVIERDAKGGNTAVKLLTVFDLQGVTGAAPDETPPVLIKRVAVDLVPLFASAGRKVEKEIEGLAVAADRQVYAITDNDNKRPTLFLRLQEAERLLR